MGTDFRVKERYALRRERKKDREEEELYEVYFIVVAKSRIYCIFGVDA